MTQEIGFIGRLSARYAEKPAVQALVNLIPYAGGSLDVLLVARAHEIREQRLQAFLDELARHDAELTPEIIQSEDFVHAYVITARAASNTRRREKIRYFGRLLAGAMTLDESIGIDEYEEYLSILDSLSYREMLILAELDAHQLAFPDGRSARDPDEFFRYWKRFTVATAQRLEISEEELTSVLQRLQRTGLFHPIVFQLDGSGNLFLDPETGKGELTVLYNRLKRVAGEFPRVASNED